MRKLIGSICLIAGTALGAGMLALPLTLAQLGIWNTFYLLTFVCIVMYFCSMVNVELHLRARQGLPIGQLAEFFRGKGAGYVGTACVALLTFSLTAAYIYGSASVIQKLLGVLFNRDFSFSIVLICFGGVTTFLLSRSLRLIDYINRIFVVGLLFMIIFLAAQITGSLHFSQIFLGSPNKIHFLSWFMGASIIVTSFGFQLVLPTVTNLCDRQPKKIQRAVFWGSLIPLVLYCIWIFVTIAILQTTHPNFMQKLYTGSVEIGAFIEVLSAATGLQYLEIFTWGITLLAITTSAIGISLAQVELIEHLFPRITNKVPALLKVLFVLLPSLLIALYVPNAFVQALSFAGVIIVVKVIFLPLVLLKASRPAGIFFPFVEYRILKAIALAFGLAMLSYEIYRFI